MPPSQSKLKQSVSKKIQSINASLPQVSNKELEAAKKQLETTAKQKQCRSSMIHWLKSKGLVKDFDDIPLDAKKEFMQVWLSCYY